MATTYTPNLALPKPEFNTTTWHDDYYAAMNILDATITKYLGESGLVGVWVNSTQYNAGAVVVDPDSSSLFRALVTNVSAATGTFAADRLSNPTYWENYSIRERSRGAWSSGTAYTIGDFVVSGNQYAVCTTSHTASATFVGDSVYWEVLIDADTTVDLITEWATLTGATVTGSSEYSAKEYAIGATVPAGSAKTWATASASSATLASQWATLTGSAVSGGEYSAKEYAQGTTVASGSAKDWASETGGTVDGSEYSAKEWAQGSTVPSGSAKEWATTAEDSLVDGAEYSAKHYAAKAADAADALDLPASLVGQAGKYLQVNPGETAYQLTALAGLGELKAYTIGTSTSDNTTTATSMQSSSLAVTHTRQSATSTLIVIANFPGYITMTNASGFASAAGNFELYDGSSSYATRRMACRNQDSGNNVVATLDAAQTIIHTQAAGATGDVTFTVRYSAGSASTTAGLLCSTYGTGWIIVLELGT